MGVMTISEIAGMESTLPYLHGRTWASITREERFFCAELYFVLRRLPTLRPFIAWLNAQGNAQQLPEDDLWDVGYEVCFYRDHIHAFGFGGTTSIRDKVVPDTDLPFMVKRTYDLALFHSGHLVIIEAKAQQGWDRKQLDSLGRDRKDVKAMFKGKGQPEIEVHAILLAQKKHLAPMRDKQGVGSFTHLISWDQVAEQAAAWGADAHSLSAFSRACVVT